MAKLWVDAGHEVRLSSRHPEDLQGLVKRLGKGASAGTPVEAGEFGEVIMMTVPLASVPDLARDLGPLLSNKVVLDTGNAYEKRDGEVAHLATGHPEGSAAWAAAMFPGASVVNGGLVLVIANGGPGSGNGVVGGAAAVVLGLIATALGGLALARRRIALGPGA
jgi:hypothetical protein